jgi:hypothetical protein
MVLANLMKFDVAAVTLMFIFFINFNDQNVGSVPLSENSMVMAS